MATEEPLNQKTFNAAGPSLILKVLTQAIQLVVGIIMVRLLSPADYGLWGIIMVFWSVSMIFVYGGFGAALLQQKEISQEELSSVFYYNIVLSLVACGGIILAAPAVGRFFQQPELVSMLQAVAWAIPLTAVSSMQHNLLYHKLRQDISNWCIFLGYVVGIPITLYLGWRGYGAWSLVWQMLTASVVTTIVVFLFVRWLPSLTFSFSILKRLFKFGSNLLLAGLLDNIFTNIYNVIIGKVYPLTTLGYYDRARQYAAIWPQSIQWTIGSVLFPAFSKIQDDIPRLRNAFIASLRVSVFIVTFPSLLLGALAYPFIELILSEKWLPIVVYFQILTANFVLFPLMNINYQILTARGKSGTYLYLEVLNKLLIAVNILCTVWFDVIYMIIGMVVVSGLSLLINTRYTNREIGYSLGEQLKDVFPYFLYSFIASASAWGLYQALYPFNKWASLILPGIAGCLIYAGLNWFFRTYAFVTVWTMGCQQIRGWLKREEVKR